ncbi:MAG TPA: DUF3857 domain-containing transglutaminase family protein [Candidatus Angelobacter sp.]|nr:DUF3857 domain-containing transglutaminase family protein [Candidatus Angelobacter sp.]
MLTKPTNLVLLLLLMAQAVNSRASVPDWIRTLAQQPARSYADDVNAVVLLHETETTVKDNGETITRERRVIKVLRPDGRSAAYQGVPFDEETRLNYFKGWSISGKGLEYEAKKDDVAEVAAGAGYEIYSDAKAKVMRIPGVDVGTVVGVEWEQKRHPYTFEDHWFFQRSQPVERARFILHLPAGWEFRASWIHHAEQAPQVQGATYIWDLTNIPRIEDELEMPHWRALAGQLVVTYFSEKTRGRDYSNWSDFAAWYNQLTSGMRDPSPALQQKVQELAPANLPLMDRIKALARFAQRDVRYAAIEIGIGGFQPHPASQVFNNRYGDCKDKATVLSAMLAQIGVKSYYVPVHTDRGVYTEKTPPTNGFNHVILAIQLPQGSFKTPMAALYEHPQLGHLLIFDPTSRVVPLGEIPSYEQDNYGLLVTEQGGELIHLPLSTPEANRITRTAKLTLMPDGSMKGEVQEIRTGSEAAIGRYTFEHQTTADRRKTLEQFLGRMMGNFQLDSVEADNLDDIEKELVIRYKFTADHYAKNTGPLLLVRPRVVGEKLGALDLSKPRHYPYEFDAPTLQTDAFEFNLPEGYKIDELPDAAQASFFFGEYNSKIENAGHQLKYSREYKINAVRVPAEKINDLGKFFHQINQDERNMAVLKKGN